MSIYPDKKNGKLTGRFRVEVRRNGQTLKGRRDTLEEAKELEASLMMQLTQGLEPSPPSRNTRKPVSALVSSRSLKECYDRAKGILWHGQSTEYNSWRKLDRIVSFWGMSTPVDDINTSLVDDLIASLQETGCSDATVNRYLSAVSAFLKFCKKRELRKSDLPELEWKDEDEGRIRWITYDEEKALLDLLPEPYATIAYVGIRTGMRVSEILSLKVDQLEPRWVHLWKTKNGTHRDVPITQELHDLLSPLVTQGTMPTYPQLRHQWDVARKAIGLMDDPSFVFHACRHTFATRAVQAGMNIRVLQKIMGHKTIQTTLRYAHVEDSTLSEAHAKTMTFHHERGNQGGGKVAHRAPRGASRTAEIPRSEMFGVSPMGLQILARRFDSGSGLQGNQQFNDND